jgi:hypothetical protein
VKTQNNHSRLVIRWVAGILGLLFLVCFLLVIGRTPAFSEEKVAEEYKFEVSETEKKPYHIGGYIEAMPVLFGLDKNA